MKTLQRRSMWVVVLTMFALFAMPDALAQRGGRSRSKPRSKPRSTPRKASPKKTSKKTVKKNSSWGKKKAKASSSKGSKADKALYENAKRNGTSYKTRGEASSAFKTKMANQKRADGNSTYSSKYATQPGSRPGHIPQSCKSGGNTYNISYNTQYGGYGYMGMGGTWMMYDAMADAAMMGMLMRNQGYYYGAAPRYYGGTVLTVIGGTAVILVLGVIFFKRKGT